MNYIKIFFCNVFFIAERPLQQSNIFNAKQKNRFIKICQTNVKDLQQADSQKIIIISEKSICCSTNLKKQFVFFYNKNTDKGKRDAFRL